MDKVTENRKHGDNCFKIGTGDKWFLLMKAFFKNVDEFTVLYKKNSVELFLSKIYFKIKLIALNIIMLE